MAAGGLAAVLASATPAWAGQLRAGAAAVDASWHVGASAGQYASDGAAIDPAHGNFDPSLHATRRAPSYGVQSRLEARAIVVEGPAGNRIALVKNDLYIPQDLLWRRTAQILESKPGLGIGRTNLTMAVSHNHSSPYYSSTAWGAWLFQDVFDVRFYNYYAERMAEAVERAAAGMVPVRVGAAVGNFDKTPRHSFGPAIADDGTPAGYPHSDTDHELTVVRFDDISDPANPRPLANLVNFALHPEFLDGNDLISGDYLAPLQEMTDRATGALTIWTQGAVGTAEPERSTYHSIHERLEFTHQEYAQAEYGARLMSDTIVDTWQGIAGFDSDFAAGEVAMEDRWFPGPITHPIPGVSNCRTDPLLAGNPQIPLVGLPDCQSLGGALEDLTGISEIGDAMSALDPGLSTDDFQRLGIPVPENYGAPSYLALQEDIDIHLQAFRLGDILFTVCSCEQWADQSRNIRTRTDRVAGNEYLGYDWKQLCGKRGDGDWDCPDPRDPEKTLPPLSDERVERMHRQVVNPANGWNDPAYALQADSEPTDPAQIKGNYTHDDDAASAQRGYRLTVPISMANDYNGYIATYREFQRGDHYRKALTGWGPHSSDYIATRLVNMGRVLGGGDRATLLPAEYGDGKVPVDLAVNDARALALGLAGTTLTALYEGLLPDDGGQPGAVRQPPDLRRFDGTSFTWTGGSNYTDNPRVKVQRLEDGEWVDYAGQSGEIPVTLRYPQVADLVPYESGSYEWRWTAHFEAFASRITTVEGMRATPAGTYRFAVQGQRRLGGQVLQYSIESEPFDVRAWDGITVHDLRLDADRRVSFELGPRGSRQLGELTSEIGPIDYPDSYAYEDGASLPRFIGRNLRGLADPDAPDDPGRIEWFCPECSFRPWLDFGDAERAALTFAWPGGRSERVLAERENGRWRSLRPLPAGAGAVVGAGCVRDPFGNYNGGGSARLGRIGSLDAACPLDEPLRAALSCAKASGRLKGRRLGRLRLGYRRARNRRLMPGFRRPRRWVDRVCHADGGSTRVGYPSPRLRRGLPGARARRLKGRAVLVLSSSSRYRVRGVRHGTRLRRLRREFGGRLGRLRVGANTWFLAPRRGARLVFKVRRGRVRELGVANPRLTRGRARARRFLRSFS